MEPFYRIIVYQHSENIVDIEGVITLIEQQMTFIGYHQTREEILNEMMNSMKVISRSVLFVAYNDIHKAIGFAFGNVCSGIETHGDYFWLNELFVPKEQRNHGLGSFLLDFVKQYGKDQGYGYIAMVTHPKNQNAQAFYKRQGFELENLIWVDTYL